MEAMEAMTGTHPVQAQENTTMTTPTPDPRAALEYIADQLERDLEHDAECEAWDNENAPAVDDAECDCGVANLYRRARAALATPPAPEAAVERCAWTRDGFRCNDTPLQHRVLCCVLHEHSIGCHPFTMPTPTPPAPTEAAEALPECEFPEPCCYLNHEYEEPCTLPPVKVVFTQTLDGPAAARAPLTVERLARALHPYYHDAAYSCRQEPGGDGQTRCQRAATAILAALEAQG